MWYPGKNFKDNLKGGWDTLLDILPITGDIRANDELMSQIEEAMGNLGDYSDSQYQQLLDFGDQYQSDATDILDNIYNQQRDNINTEKDSVNDRITSLEDWFAENNINYEDTAEAKFALEQMKENQKDQINDVSKNKLRTGGTIESELASRKDLNENFNDSLAGFTSKSTAYKEGLRNEYDSKMNNLINTRISLTGMENSALGDYGQGNLSILNDIFSNNSNATGDYFDQMRELEMMRLNGYQNGANNMSQFRNDFWSGLGNWGSDKKDDIGNIIPFLL